MDFLHASGTLSDASMSAMSGVPAVTRPAPRPGVAGAAVSTGLAAAALFGIAVVLALLGGCEGRVSLMPNHDPALRKSPPQFAADAAKRAYRADAPRGGDAAGRAEVDYAADVVQVVNLSDDDWRDVELWVNKSYVVFLPQVDKGAPRVTVLNFRMLYDDAGRSFPTNNLDAKDQVRTVEVFRDGKMYDVRVALAD